MTDHLDQYSLIFFFFGFLIVSGYSLQRFNEPSFPNRENLPRTLTPLRYLFLRSAYQKARLTYVAAALLVYVLLVALGHDIISALGGAGVFPEKAWPLAVATLMSGLSVAPDSFKWVNKIEDLIRQWVHTWFLVPDGVERTIGVMDDANYKPSPAQLNEIASPLKEQIKENLKLSRASLRYRWARASMLMELLNLMHAGADHLLKKENFAPFEADFEEIDAKYKALASKIAATTSEETLADPVDKLLKRIYAYISWGIWYQVDSQKAVDDKLEELGFRIPTVGDRRLFDIVAPPVLLIALITMVFYLSVEALSWAMKSSTTLSQGVVNALISTTVASVMYGWAMYIALNERGKQIDQKVWQRGSPRRLVPIAIRAGLVTLVTIVVTTLVWRFSAILLSLPKLANAIRTFQFPIVAADDPAPWNLLPVKTTAALPWFLVGATVSVLLAYFLGGDVRRADQVQRIRDAKILGIALALAGATAQLIQISFADVLGAETISLGHVTAEVAKEGLAGFLCGAVIGFMVPAACRNNLITPPDLKMARALEGLLHDAETTLGSRAAAENWVFTPNNELLGISPAEAVQYEGLATGVQGLLARAGEADVIDRSDAARPIIIEGGRAA